LEDKTDEKFIVVWTSDGETTSISHSTQDAALRQAEKLLREHGCDLEITIHLDDKISPPPSIWFNKKRMQQWCLAGFPRPNLSARAQRVHGWPFKIHIMYWAAVTAAMANAMEKATGAE
jgi:hypothetical protein